jgi:hypothetical protein
MGGIMMYGTTARGCGGRPMLFICRKLFFFVISYESIDWVSTYQTVELSSRTVKKIGPLRSIRGMKGIAPGLGLLADSTGQFILHDIEYRGKECTTSLLKLRLGASVCIEHVCWNKVSWWIIQAVLGPSEIHIEYTSVGELDQ